MVSDEFCPHCGAGEQYEVDGICLNCGYDFFYEKSEPIPGVDFDHLNHINVEEEDVCGRTSSTSRHSLLHE